MIFWITIATLSALSLLILLRPLLKNAESAPANTAESDLAVYKDQLREIERDLASGNLASTQAETAKLEIQRRILNASDGQSSTTRGNPLSGSAIWALVWSLVVSFPLIGLLLYFQLGSPDLGGQPFAQRDIAAEQMAIVNQQENARNNEMLMLAEKLEARLQQDPEKPDGWMLLGSTYAELQEFARAEEAFRNAEKYSPASPVIYGAIGEMLVVQNNGQVTNEAIKFFRQSLELDPRDARGLYYSGLALAQSGDNDSALQVWLTLRQTTREDDPWLPVLDSRIGELADNLQLSSEELIATAPALAPESPETQLPTGPDAEDMAAAAELSSEDRQAMIDGMVDQLAERLKTTPDDFEGWLRLIRSYHTLGRNDDLATALEQAEAAAARQTDVPLAMTQLRDLEKELDL
ncbi:c-type cytochrome biogenesis protein CcmI [Kiloniella laminariae]|uniref:c-type cytochrome biogenesis protein CcmI n=1 Tax=Kiloniella laminariae TaxID=454162 RepID=UPI00037C0796|nr:c-type cytochrome biogenesis protein CcmI [Kiloniella laminariae]